MNADPPERDPRSFAASAGERQIAWQELERLDTKIARLGEAAIPNPCSEETLGLFRSEDSGCAVLADMDYISHFASRSLPVPHFQIAGPHERLFFPPATVRAAVVTSGGIAPGLNRVLHAIVQRHCATYGGGEVLGVFDGIAGLTGDRLDCEPLTPEQTERLHDEGGSLLGSRRQYGIPLEEMARRAACNLRAQSIRILYMIGGDGSLRAANAVAELMPDIAVVGVPKTMDNDILWASPSFGFHSSVEKAVEVLGSMRTESQSTRRIGLVELFGAQSGCVASHAAHAFGHVMLVLIPEMFAGCETGEELRAALLRMLDHAIARVAKMERAHGLIVIAEGVGKLMRAHGVTLCAEPRLPAEFAYQIDGYLAERLRDARGNAVGLFVNRPRHHIRAFPPNAFDRTYCDRLGALAVETALAGLTRCVVSQWLGEMVLVPFGLVCRGRKSTTLTSLLWKQVMQATGQPASSPS